MADVIEDVVTGDFVRRIGAGKVGLVENVANGYATVAWNKDWRVVLACADLEKVALCGDQYDVRRP